MPPPRDVKKQQELAPDEKRVVSERYRVEKKLGSGNFGTAFLVTDLKEANELKVLKEVSVGDMQSDESIESVHEAHLLAKLDNPYILKYFDSFLDGEYFCIVTEYCEGGDLDQRFKKNKKEGIKLSEEQVLDWTVQLLSAVNYMHSRRVLHRDLKARNIFLRNEIVKIGDFGISRILQGTMDMASTFTGTPYYMSPEVLKHEGYNSKSDVWSVGCLLYEMCTYQHAFEGQGLMGVMYKIVEGRVPELPSTYSRELNGILKKIFQKDPNLRPSSSDLLKEPFVSNHVKSMIKRFEASKIDELESTMVIRNDRNEIAKALNTKVSLKDLQAQKLPKIQESSISSPAAAKPSAAKSTKVTSTPVIRPQEAAAAATPKVEPQPQPQVQEKKPTSILKAPKQQQQQPPPPPPPQPPAVKKEDEEYDDDEDVHSGINQPVLQRPKPSSQLPTQSVQQGAKELTPKEKMLLNKLKKADEEAAKLGQVAKENYEERMLRDTFRREATIHGSTIWNKQQQQQQQQQANDDYQTNILQKSIRNAYANMNQQQQYEYDFDEDDGTILKTVKFIGQDQPLANMAYRSSIGDIPRQSEAVNNSERPIRPMKSNFALEQAFDDDGIPSDPQLTNAYYENFDFENDSSPERRSFGRQASTTRNSLSQTIAPSRRVATAGVVRKPLPSKYVTGGVHNQQSSNNQNHQPHHHHSKQQQSARRHQSVASKTISGNQPSQSRSAQLEYEQLIALSNQKNYEASDTFGDDLKTGVFGQNARAIKIQNLKAKAVRKLGSDVFDRCYSYLKEQRFGPSSAKVEETKVVDGLRQISNDEVGCFLVDQLVFLERENMR